VTVATKHVELVTGRRCSQLERDVTASPASAASLRLRRHNSIYDLPRDDRFTNVFLYLDDIQSQTPNRSL